MLKNFIKKCFINIFSTPIFNLENKLLNYDVISFDIFDTLIKRDIKEPTDVFELIEKKYKIKDFKKNRINAEKLAREKSKYEEVTLDEIYSNINLSKSKIKRLKEIEIQTEINICTKNKEIFKIYKKLINQKKEIYFTSDMYLPIDTIKKILENNGFNKYKKVYLSSNEKISKGNSTLFKKIIEDNHLENKSIIHIGDSIKGDFINPRKNNIDSILIKRNINNCLFTSKNNNTLDYNILSSFINNRIDPNWNEYEKFGYEVFGPILYSFTSFVHQKVKEDKIDKIYFLARDAKIIMDVYNERFKDNIPIYYIYLSRRLLIATQLHKVNSFKELYDTLNTIIKDTSKIKDILNFLNIKYNTYEKKLLDNDIDLNDVLMDLDNDKKEILFNLIKDELKEFSLQQKEYLKRYLKQNKFSKNVALIDIGWNGTIQNYLSKLSNTSIKGYYYGVFYGKKDKYNEIKRYGYLFDENNKNDYKNIIKFNIGLFELMFLSTEGSTIKLDKKDNTIIPIKGEVDLDKDNIEKVLKIQKTAKKFIEDITKSNDNLLLSTLNKECYFENYKNIITNPTLKQINMFKEFEFNNLSKDKLINNKSLLYYLLHPKKLYIDFRNSTCRIMFMKSIFKIQLPYYKILKKIYEVGDLQ